MFRAEVQPQLSSLMVRASRIWCRHVRAAVAVFAALLARALPAVWTALLLGATGVPEAAVQQSPPSACDPTVRQAPENPWGYRPRGQRCEGMYLRDVGAVPLRVVALTEGTPAFDPAAGALHVEWTVPRNSGAVRLRAESLRHRTYYRMDAVAMGTQRSFEWPSEVLAAQGLTPAELALTASTPFVSDGQERVLLLPARVHQGRPDSGSPAPVVLTLWPGLELEELFLTVHGPDGTALVDGRSLGRSFYPAERALSVKLPAVAHTGVHRVRVAATLRGGGSTSVDAWVHLVR